jgi:histidyl-tRNA synthetase
LNKFDTLPGFREFPPDACAQRNHLFRVFRTVARAFDFQEYDVPVVEPLDLYLQKSGEEIASQLFHFEDKGGRKVALRPELTPTLARMIAARANSLPKPVKWFNIGEHFRYERPQKGRGRSFYQFNADLVGEPGVDADAELIALLASIFETFGLRSDDVVIRLSDRVTWVLFLDQLNISEDARPATLDAIDKSERRKPEQTIESLNQANPGRGEELFAKILEIKGLKSLDDIVTKLESYGEQGKQRAEDWKNLTARLDAHGCDGMIQVDLSIVRGLAYYTGFVYEAFEASGEGRALAGGGRYDHLIQKLSGNCDLPAAGFAIGDMTLSDCLGSKNLLPRYVIAPDLFLIFGESERDMGLRLSSHLRKAGHSTTYSLKPSGFGKQFKDAGKSGARYAIILGEDEVKQSSVKVKDLRSGSEETCKIQSLVEKIEDWDGEGGISAEV